MLVLQDQFQLYPIQKHKTLDSILPFVNLVGLVFKNQIHKIIIKQDSIHIFCTKECQLLSYFLKNSTFSQFDELVDISAVDSLSKNDIFESAQRFNVTYQLISLSNSYRLNLSFGINDLESAHSLCKIFRNASWLEREVWDLFGIFFNNHPDMRRILTDYGFKGHPLRKDFPLTGYLELFYDDSLKMLTYKPVSLAQEYRNFQFSNPWLK